MANKITVIVDSELGHGKYTVARRIKELIEKDNTLDFFDITVKVATTDNIDLKKEENNGF